MYVHLKVTAGAKKELLRKIDETHYVLAVKAEAKNNAANKRVLELMKLELENDNIRLVTGHHSPSKIIDVGN